MKNATVRVVFTVIALALGGVPAGASAAEIKVLATIALQSVMEDLAPRFEKASGHKVSIAFGLGVPLAKRVQEAEAADLLLAPRGSTDGLIKPGTLEPASHINLHPPTPALPAPNWPPNPPLT